MKRRILILIAALLGVILLAGWSLSYRAAQEAALESFATSDGRIVTVEHISYGKNHTFNPPSGWKQKWQQIAPGPLKGIFGSGSSSAYGVPQDSLGVWLSFTDPLTGKSSPVMGGYLLESIDEHGCTARSRGAMTTTANGRNLLCLTLDTFPRDRDRIQLRLYDNKGGDKLLAVISVPNPVPYRSRPWPAEALLKKTKGNLEVSFLRWHNVASRIFEIKEGGQGTTHWFFEDVTLEDQFGNRSMLLGNRSIQLCRLERLWKINANFFQDIAAAFPSSNLVTLGHFQPGGSLTFNSTNIQAHLNNAPFTLLGFGTPGQHTFSNGIHVASIPLPGGAGGLSSSTRTQGGVTISTVDFPADKSFVAFRPPAIKSNEKLFVRATDPDGGVFRGEFGGMANGIGFYSFDVPPETKSLTVDLIVQEAKQFEFYAPPPLKEDRL